MIDYYAGRNPDMDWALLILEAIKCNTKLRHFYCSNLVLQV